MDSSVFYVMAAIVVACAFSIIRGIRGSKSITDPLIRHLFRYINSMVLAILALSFSLILETYTISASLQNNQVQLFDIMSYILLISVFILVLGSMLVIRRISDIYGFKVKE